MAARGGSSTSRSRARRVPRGTSKNRGSSGKRGDDSPTDIGSLTPSDLADMVQQYTTVNRILVEYNIPPVVPRNQEVALLLSDPTVAEVAADPQIRRYRLKGVLEDQLILVRLGLDSQAEEVEVGDFFFAARNTHMQNEFWLEQNDDEDEFAVEYSFIDSITRIKKEFINDNLIISTQTVEPPYVPETDIIYAATVEGTGLVATTLIDMNIDGRIWGAPKPLKAYTYLFSDLDVIFCQPVDEVEGNVITIAKPHALQATPWTGTIGGFTYVSTGNESRTVNGEEQVVIAQYDADQTIIYAFEPVGGTGASFAGEPVLLQDANIDGRMWAAVPPELED